MAGKNSDRREAFAAEFDRSLDPLVRFEASFERVETDPFELFITDVLLADDPKAATIKGYRIAFKQWKAYMRTVGRHPACPNDAHVRGFAHWLQDEKDNRAIETIRQKLSKISRVYRFWQQEPSLPHDEEYNPIKLGQEKISWSRFEDTPDKRPHPIPLDKLRRRLTDLDTLRQRAYVVTQLKLGLRVGELCNITLGDVNLQCSELDRHYPDLGTHPRVADRPNAIYIPSKHERDGNKSSVERILPVDDELRAVMRRYLLVRPMIDSKWLYLSPHHTQSTTNHVNRAWRSAFHPQYEETDEHRAVTSHFGRHWFTTYWKKTHGLQHEFIQYMRGDLTSGLSEPLEQSTIDPYLHTYYEDIEAVYRENVYTLFP